MRLIVDTNRFIAALIKNLVSRKIIMHLNAQLFSIKFSKDEVIKYKHLILKKSNLNEIEFEIILEKLKTKLILIDDGLISLKIPKASRIMDEIDPDDTSFLAAALAINGDIWYDDKHFDKQNLVKVWKTKDLVKFL